MHDDFTAILADKAKWLKIGHPLDPDTVVGPLIHPEHEAKVLSYFDIARDEGVTRGEEAGAETFCLTTFISCLED